MAMSSAVLSAAGVVLLGVVAAWVLSISGPKAEPFNATDGASQGSSPLPNQGTKKSEEIAYVPVLGAGKGLENIASDLHVDIESLVGQIESLALISDHDPPSVTRILFTEKDVGARNFVKEKMEEVGLVVREDAIGNIFGRWEGREAEEGAVVSGSHTDAIPFAGKFDGVVGVLGAIEAIATLKRAGFVPKRSIEALMFTSEEPTRFGFGCLGSRVMSNQSAFIERLLALRDKNGTTFMEAASEAGYGALNADSLDSVVVRKGRISSFVELHIEQGPTLEQEGISVGVVSAIAAPSAISVDLVGTGGHAGGLLMPFRNDAGLAAAEVALAVEHHALTIGTNDTVATTGHVSLLPNAVNSVPRQAHLEIDVRDVDGERRDQVMKAIRKSTDEIARKRNVKLERFEVLNSDPPATCSPIVVSAITSAADELNLSSKVLVSRAYHDSLFMAQIAPTGMIFIPCYKGYSHRPDEFTSKENLQQGVRVLALTLAKLSLQ